jgi:hypothetical protein
VKSIGNQKILNHLENCFYDSLITTPILSKFFNSFKVCINMTILFYSYSKNAISIRTGGVLNIEDCKMVKNPKNDPNHWQTLCIEAEVFKKIRDVFMYSFFKLNEDRKLESVFTAPLFTQQEQQKMSQLKYLNMNGSMNGHGPTLSLPTDVKS